MWLYISWLILLVGAQASFYIQHPEYLRIGYRQLNVGNQMREQSALSLMLMVAEAFRDGGKSYTTNQVAARLNVPGIVLGPLTKRLVAAGLLEVGKRDQLIPARDPGGITLGDVIAAVRSGHEQDIFQHGDWPTKVDKVFTEIDALTSGRLGTTSLYALLDEEPAGLGAAPGVQAE